VLKSEENNGSVTATLICKFDEDRSLKEHYTVNENGVTVAIEGDGEIGYALPAFCFDGEAYSQISSCDNCLTVSYEGWTCRYTVNGAVLDLNRTAANRNGHYRAFLAVSENELDVKIEIVKNKNN
jgi:hypothetical protein